MALSALETTEITQELTIQLTQGLPKIRAVMLAAGVAGEGAKATDVTAVVTTVLSNLFGQTAPVIGP